MANVPRQERALLTNVARGTPTTLATVMPPTITATAAAPLPGPLSLEHTMAPAPKKAPWGSPLTKRAAMSDQKLGESAAAVLPMMINDARKSSSLWSGMRRSTMSIGAPTATPVE